MEAEAKSMFRVHLTRTIEEQCEMEIEAVSEGEACAYALERATTAGWVACDVSKPKVFFADEIVGF